MRLLDIEIAKVTHKRKLVGRILDCAGVSGREARKMRVYLQQLSVEQLRETVRQIQTMAA